MQSPSLDRKFEDTEAVRSPTPLLFGLIGPSGSGKTYSALRLATGMQRVFGGEIFVVDTESRRALHYAKDFKFRHVEFAPPFSPLDYLAAIEHCVTKGAKTIIVDSMSHEHDGAGGVLEWHTEEVNRIAAAWRCSEEKATIPAWNKPKTARRRLINCLLQMQANFIFCFRAKEKIRIGKQELIPLGYMPIAGEEFVYELTAKSLLLPGANGVPTWRSENPGERMMIKLPEQFRGIFNGADGKPLDEDIGEQMARWAAGDIAGVESGGLAEELQAQYSRCKSLIEFEDLEAVRARMWPGLAKTKKSQLKVVRDAAAVRIQQAQQ